MTGVVEQLGNAGGRGGNLIAFVRVGGGSIMEISLAYDDQCHSGDPIRFHRQRHLLGATAKADMFPCATSSDQHP
jgi:hypothetical protein